MYLIVLLPAVRLVSILEHRYSHEGRSVRRLEMPLPIAPVSVPWPRRFPPADPGPSARTSPSPVSPAASPSSPKDCGMFARALGGRRPHPLELGSPSTTRPATSRRRPSPPCAPATCTIPTCRASPTLRGRWRRRWRRSGWTVAPERDPRDERPDPGELRRLHGLARRRATRRSCSTRFYPQHIGKIGIAGATAGRSRRSTRANGFAIDARLIAPHHHARARRSSRSSIPATPPAGSIPAQELEGLAELAERARPAA